MPEAVLQGDSELKTTETLIDAAISQGFPYREPRRATKWIGRIRLTDGSELPCFIRDVSKSGLKISVPPSFALSKSALLIIDDRNIEMIVNVVWRQGIFVGVRIKNIGRIKGRPKWIPSFDE